MVAVTQKCNLCNLYGEPHIWMEIAMKPLKLHS